ncbi:MAG: hypothetical protein GX259_08915 [Bacteroidales bacterium]|nr:hypothetical protein [Bacteroidales bacterium]
MDITQSNEILLSFTVEDLQLEAIERIGRKLNDEEIRIAKKGLESGLLTSIDVVYSTIFNEMIKYE